MTLSPEIQDSIKIYLWEVATYLGAASLTVRTEILRDVESHIHEALAARSTEPTNNDLQAVLAEMPAPASYASEGMVGPKQSGGRLTWNELPGSLADIGTRFVSRLGEFAWESFVGPILLFIACNIVFRGLLIFIGGVYFHSTAPIGLQRDAFGNYGIALPGLGVLMLLLGWGVLVWARKIGWQGIIRINSSGCRLRGFVGSYITFVVSKVLLVSLLLGVGMGLFFAALGFLPWTHPFILLVLPIIGILDYFLIKSRWSPSKLHRCSDAQVNGG